MSMLCCPRVTPHPYPEAALEFFLLSPLVGAPYVTMGVGRGKDEVLMGRWPGGVSFVYTFRVLSMDPTNAPSSCP